MKVGELIALLEEFDDCAEVRIAQPTHDHWRSVIARGITTVESTQVQRSEYHGADVLKDGGEIDCVVIGG